MRAYHRIDPLMDDRKGHYTPAQFGAFLKVQLIAGRQTRRGRFRSVAALKGMLPSSYVRSVDFLVEQGDIIPAGRHDPCKQCPEGPIPRGEVYVDGWDEWQEGDLTVSERMGRLRNKRRNSTVTPTVTSAVTEPSPPAIGVGVGVSTGVSTGVGPASAGVAREMDELEVAVHGLRNGNATLKQIDTFRGLREQIDDDPAFYECLREWAAAPVEDRYGKAMAELVDLAARHKSGRGSKAVKSTTSYDALMQSDDEPGRAA